MKKRGYPSLALRIMGISVAFLIYLIYIFIYPSESIFINEFESQTTLNFPESANFKGMAESSIDIHGDYWNLAVVEVSDNDYDKLLSQTISNKEFKPDTSFNIIGNLSDVYKYRHNKNDVSYTKTIEKFKSYTIGFSADKKTIVLQLFDM